MEKDITSLESNLFACAGNNNTALSIYLVHQMAAEASKEEMGSDSSEDEPAKGGEDFQQDHQDHQTLQHLEILVSTIRYVQ